MNHFILGLLYFSVLPSFNCQTIKIGKQIWSAENLNVNRFRNGDLIPQARTSAEWIRAGKSRQPAWCYYQNKDENGNKYGMLYNWFAVQDERGLAPAGWHIPTDDEWIILENHLASIVGVKDTVMVGFEDEIVLFTNNLDGLPAGMRFDNGVFQMIRRNGYWWSATEESSFTARCRSLNNRKGLIPRHHYYKEGGLSVRCIKDE